MTAHRLPYPLTARSLWHWINNQSSGNSAMAAAADTAQLGILYRVSGLNGDWGKTKAGSTDFGGHSNADAKIWCDQIKQHLRSLVNKLPVYDRAMGNVLYMPSGDMRTHNLVTAHNGLYRRVMASIKKDMPSLKPEKLAAVNALTYCAICHYWEIISPAIEGGTPGSIVPSKGGLRELMAARGCPIDTRYFSRAWYPLWRLIITEIQATDARALQPLETWCIEYFENLEQSKKTERV